MVDVNSIPIIRERRKTYTLVVDKDGKPCIKAPYHIAETVLRDFAAKHIEWLESRLAKSSADRERLEDVATTVMDIATIMYGLQYTKISGHINKDTGEIRITVPFNTTEEDIKKFVLGAASWFEKHSVLLANAGGKTGEFFTSEEIDKLFVRVEEIIPAKVQYWAQKTGVSYGIISFANTLCQWGRCARTGDLQFNCLLALCPDDIIDSVIVHELCHRKQMNHSDKFYQEVLGVMPDYWEKRKWIITEGGKLLKKLRNSKLPMRKVIYKNQELL